MRRLVQYVILLPLFFNDGRPVPAERRLETYEELIQQFGGLTVEEVDVRGFWVHEGVRYQDVAKRVIVAAEATPENDAFMRQLKETLKERFEQIDIWISAQTIDLI
jgi:hypothetical protein